MRQRILLGMIFSFLFGFSLIACGAEPATPVPTNTAVPPTDTPPPPTDTPTPEIAGDPERGSEIFEIGGAHVDYKPRYACANCHTLDGSEDNGPSLQGISARAGDRVPELSAAEYIRQSIMEPREYIVEGFSSMGSINSLVLSEEEVNDLVAFLFTQ